MKCIFVVLSILITFKLSATELKVGDVILISFNCFECKMIESETNSNFSHSGVVIRDENGNLKIAQSLGVVALYNLNDFLKNKTPNTKAFVYRSYEIESQINSKFEADMKRLFDLDFKGALFDVEYKWNNFDKSGRELLYCSEFIAKFLDHFQKKQTIPFVLTYNKNYKYWNEYFHGKVPEGELGNSPASFSRDNRFYFVGNLD